MHKIILEEANGYPTFVPQNGLQVSYGDLIFEVSIEGGRIWASISKKNNVEIDELEPEPVPQPIQPQPLPLRVKVKNEYVYRNVGDFNINWLRVKEIFRTDSGNHSIRGIASCNNKPSSVYEMISNSKKEANCFYSALLRAEKTALHKSLRHAVIHNDGEDTRCIIKTPHFFCRCKENRNTLFWFNQLISNQIFVQKSIENDPDYCPSDDMSDD